MNELGIVTGMGIDKIGNEYLISAQVIRPTSIAGQGGTSTIETSQIITFEARGKTIPEAVRKLSTQVSRELYFSHLRVLAIGDEFARQGIGPVLDFFSRDHEFRSDFSIVIVHKDRAEDLLDVLAPLENIPTLKIYQSISISEKIWGHTIIKTIDELISEITSKGKEPVFSGIEIKGHREKGERTTVLKTSDPDTILQHIHMAVFKQDKLIGWLTSDESFGTNFVLDKIKSTVITIPCKKSNGKQRYISAEIIHSKTKNKVEFIDNKPIIHVDITTEASIADIPCKIDITKTEEIYKIERKLEKEIQKKVATTIHNVQKKFKSDIFGFGEVIHRKNPKVWRKLEKNWDQHFATLPVEVNVKVKVLRTGTTNNSFLKNIK
jgi:spore germination protein KC